MEMHGGVARDGWHAIGLGYKKLLKDGKPATALVKTFWEMDDDEGGMPIGNVQHEFTLEVRVEGQAPYDLKGLFRMPPALVGVVGPGMVVPVRVHPKEPNKVAIAWKEWDPATAPVEQVSGATEGDASFTMMQASSPQQVHAAMPDASRKMMMDGWIQARKAGALSAADLEQALNDSVQAGMLTAAEADEVRKASA